MRLYPFACGKLEVVVLPGLDGTTALLAPFLAALHGRGVAASAVGYPTDRSLDYDALEPLVRAQLPRTPFVLLGESFSGPLAIRIAVDPPPGLRGLVLSTTFARSPVPALRALARLVRFAPTRLPMPLMRWALLGRWTRPGLEAALADALASVAPATLRARAAAALTVDVSARLDRVQVSTLNLVATHDRLLAPPAGRVLANGLRHCRTERFAGPHLLLQAMPEACADAVAAFALGLGCNDAATA